MIAPDPYARLLADYALRVWQDSAAIHCRTMASQCHARAVLGTLWTEAADLAAVDLSDLAISRGERLEVEDSDSATESGNLYRRTE